MINPDDIKIATNPADIHKLLDPTSEFDSTLAMIEADKKAKMQAELDRIQGEQAKKQAPAQKEPKPLKLEYTFTGTCGCGTVPTTIMLDTDAGYFANAFCIPEVRQLISVKVEKLPSIIMPEKEKKK